MFVCAVQDAHLRRELSTDDVEKINKENVLVSLFVYISTIFHHIESSAVLVMCLKNQVIAIYCPKCSEKHVVQWSLSRSLSSFASICDYFFSVPSVSYWYNVLHCFVPFRLIRFALCLAIQPYKLRTEDNSSIRCEQIFCNYLSAILLFAVVCTFLL